MRVQIRFSRGCVILSLFLLTVLSSVLQNLSVQASPVLPSGGTLVNYTPDEMVARARGWVKDHIPYNQQGYHDNYREDCSGLVSMAWGILPSVNSGGLFTGTEPDNPNQQYALSSVANLLGKALDDTGKPIMSTMLKLQKGDILLNQVYIDKDHDYAHAVLFVGWVDKDAKKPASTPVIAKDGYYYYNSIEENGGIEKKADGTYIGYAIEHTADQPWPFPYYPGFDSEGYYAWRFDLAKASGLGYISQSGNTTPIVSPTATTKPGGQWITPPSPKNGDTVSDVIHFASQAYPTHQGDPPISLVYFTISSNSSWRVVCTVPPPTTGNRFVCNVNLKNLGISYGQIQVSFDVQDQAGNINLAPNGVHTLTYMPTPQPAPTPTPQPVLTPGTWQGQATSDGGSPGPAKLVIDSVNGNTFTGFYGIAGPGNSVEPIQNGQINGNTITFTTPTQVPNEVATYKGKISGNTITGTWSYPGGGGTFTVTKEA